MEGILKLAYQQNPGETIKLLKEAIKIDGCEDHGCFNSCHCDILKREIPEEFVNEFFYIDDIFEHNENIPIEYLRDNKDKFTRKEWSSISKWIPKEYISEFEDYVDNEKLFRNKNISLERLRTLSCNFQKKQWKVVSRWIPNAWIPEFKDYLNIWCIAERIDISFESIMLLKDRFEIRHWSCLVKEGQPELIKNLLDVIPFDMINVYWMPIENLRIVKDKLNKQSWNILTGFIPNRYLEEFRDYIVFDWLVQRSDLSKHTENIFKDEIKEAKERISRPCWLYDYDDEDEQE